MEEFLNIGMFHVNTSTAMQTSPRRRAFSLVELVIVIAVIVIIAAFTLPAMNTVLRGSHLSQGSGMLVGQLNIARQQALSRNRIVEVRFYRYADPEVPGENVADPSTGKFRAMQLFEVTSIGTGIALPLDKVQVLPGTVVFAYSDSQGLSSLLDKPTGDAPKRPGIDDPAAPKLPRGVDYNYEYVAFRFNPDGSTNRTPTAKWYITIVNANDKITAAVPPPNFFTVQVDPVSGTIRTYRPQAG